MITSCVQLRVRYSETDQMAVAYHGSYMPWFEIARTQLLRELGLPYAELEAAGHLLPVLELEVRYLRPARYDDELRIEASILQRPTVRLRLHYRILRGEDLLCTAATEHAFMNREGRAMRPPSRFREVMERAFAPSTA